MSKPQVLLLPTNAIAPNPHQPRLTFDPQALKDLAESIRRHGILQPLTVRKAPSGWELVAGERRLRAAKLVGLKTVPCLRLQAQPQESALLALVENLQRQDLHYLEEAAAIAEYLRTSGCTQEQAAGQLGRSPSALANRLRLLRLSSQCRQRLVETGLTERHARCLLRLEDEGERLSLLERAAQQGWSVAQTEQAVDRLLQQLQSTAPAGRRTFILKDVRLFLNSLDRGLRMIRESGIGAEAHREETEEDILLTIRIPKKRQEGKNLSAVTGL